MNTGKLLALSLLLALPFVSMAAWGADEKKTVFIAKSYGYLPPESGVSTDVAQTGHSLCGTKCNSISADFDSLMMAGMRLIKTVENREIRIPLDNPFLKGDCSCTGDEYEIDRVNYRPGIPAPSDGTLKSTAR